jgi:hypothetical protein
VAGNFAAKEFALAEQTAEVIVDAHAKQVFQFGDGHAAGGILDETEQSVSQGVITAEACVVTEPQAMMIEAWNLGQGVEGPVVVITGEVTQTGKRPPNAHEWTRTVGTKLRQSANFVLAKQGEQLWVENRSGHGSALVVRANLHIITVALAYPEDPDQKNQAKTWKGISEVQNTMCYGMEVRERRLLGRRPANRWLER